MKKIIAFPAFIFAAFLFSCNDSNEKADTAKEHMDHNGNNEMHTSADSNKEVKMVSQTFSNVDPGVAAFMKAMAGHYIGIKNALVNGNTGDAVSHATAMSKSLKGFDKSLLTADQKKLYDQYEPGIREDADHISESNDLDHKRSHFAMLSDGMYNLVKAFGAGMTLYHDHCPMARDNQGAMWLSETKEIRNPYFGDKMMTCGSVEEMFQ